MIEIKTTIENELPKYFFLIVKAGSW